MCLLPKAADIKMDTQEAPEFQLALKRADIPHKEGDGVSGPVNSFGKEAGRET